MSKTKFYPTPPDVVTVNIESSTTADPEVWPDERYQELIDLAETQRGEAEQAIECFRAEQAIVNARQTAIVAAMDTAFTQDEQDRLSAKWLANEPRFRELPGIITRWEERRGKLDRQRTRAKDEMHGRRARNAYQERKAKERAEQEQREAEEAELRKRIIQAKWSPQQRARYEAEQHQKATRDERFAAERAKQAADVKQQEQVNRDATTWLDA